MDDTTNALNAQTKYAHNTLVSIAEFVPWSPSSLTVSGNSSYVRMHFFSGALFAGGGKDAVNDADFPARPSWPGRGCGGRLPEAGLAIVVKPDPRSQWVG